MTVLLLFDPKRRDRLIVHEKHEMINCSDVICGHSYISEIPNSSWICARYSEPLDFQGDFRAAHFGSFVAFKTSTASVGLIKISTCVIFKAIIGGNNDSELRLIF